MGKDDERMFTKLRVFNLVMAVLHFLQGILMVILSTDFAIRITRGYLDFDPIARELYPETAGIVDIPLGPLIASFLFMSSIAHLLVGTVLYKRYVEDLKKGMNRLRWAEPNSTTLQSTGEPEPTRAKFAGVIVSVPSPGSAANRT